MHYSNARRGVLHLKIFVLLRYSIKSFMLIEGKTIVFVNTMKGTKVQTIGASLGHNYYGRGCNYEHTYSGTVT